MTTTHERDYLPGMADPRLLRYYDPFSKLIGAPEMYWRLVAQAAIEPGATVVEIGTGTGNVLLRAAKAVPSATFVGIDPDDESLALARRKAGSPNVRFERGYARSLPFDDGTVDRVLSSLMIHHLGADEKAAALAEVRRVLRPGGSLHVVDIDHGAPPPLGRLIQRLMPKHRHGHDHGPGQRHGHGHEGASGAAARGELLGLLEGAGFADVTEVGRDRTLLGGHTFYRAVNP